MELAPLVQVALPVALFLVMLGMGMTLRLLDFRRLVGAPRAFALGLGAQFLALPLLAMIIVVGFELPPELAVGLLVLSFCPSGTTSNLFSYLARADVALSISLTAVSSVVTPFTVPLLTRFALEWQLGAERSIDFPVAKTMLQLAVVVLLPLAVGMIWNERRPVACGRWQPFVHRLSVALFGAVILAMVVDLWEPMPEFLAAAGAACIAMIVSALVLGWSLASLAGLDPRQVKTVSIEVGMQHGGMALVVTQGVLASATMSIVPVLYGLLMLIPILILVVAVRIRGRDRAFAG